MSHAAHPVRIASLHAPHGEVGPPSRLRLATRRATVRGNLRKEPPIFNLIQALHETHELAEDHADEPGWTEVRQQVDDALERLTHGAGDPTTEAIGVQRIDRTVAVDEEQAELAAAAMAALHDRPEPEQLELARAALQQLHEAIG